MDQYDFALMQLSSEGVIDQVIDEDGNFLWVDGPNELVSIENFEYCTANKLLDTDKYSDDINILTIWYSDGEYERFVSLSGCELLYDHPYEVNQFEPYLPYLNEKSMNFFFQSESGVQGIKLEEKK